MKQHRKAIIVGAVLATVLAVGGGIAIASNGGDDQPLTGNALEQASAAAIAHVGGGTVTESEHGDGDAAYEVEVTKDDGSVVEVSLDSDFHVVGTESEDAEGTGDDEGGSENGSDAGEQEGTGESDD